MYVLHTLTILHTSIVVFVVGFRGKKTSTKHMLSRLNNDCMYFKINSSYNKFEYDI